MLRVGADLEFTSSCANEHTAVTDTSINGAMTIVQRLQGRWAAALVPVRLNKPWTTACELVFLMKGCSLGGECLPVGVSKNGILMQSENEM